jgi:ABC-type lipoprotein release transport system permease subunit
MVLSRGLVLLAAVSVLLTSVAVVACLPPALRALRVDPVSVLQAE